MPPHGWILALCLCHSLLGTLCAVSPDEDGTTRTSPKPQLSTEPGDLGLGSPWPTSGRRASSFWSFWAPVDLTTEAKTPSLLSLPFSLPFDLWSPSTRVPEESVPAHTSLGVTLALPSNDTVTEGSKGTSPNPATGPTWAESSATPRTGTVTLHEETDPPTPALPNSSYRPAPSLTTWLSVSPSSEKTLMPARQTEASTALPDRSTSALALGAGTTETGEPARPHNQPSATPAPVTEAAKPTFAETAGTEAKIDAGLFGEGTRAVEEHVEGGGATRGDRGAFEDAVQAPTRAVSLSAEPSGGTPSEGAGFGGTGPTEEEEPSRVWTASVPSTTPLRPLLAEPVPDEGRAPDAAANDSSLLPDCNVDSAGICNASGPWSPAFPDDNATSNQSYDPFLLLAPPMFVPLYSDWNTAMATWGLAWEAHVYGLGSLFALVAFVSVLNLLCLPFRCPSGCGYFALVNLFLLAASCSRAFSLFYDAYSHQDKLPAAGTLLLYEVPFPCLTAAFGIVFLLLSMRSRMQLSNSVFQHPCFLAVLVLLHFSATFGSVVLLQVFTRLPCLFFVSQGSFVALAAFLSAAYFAFYCYVRADAKHIYHLNNTSPPAERYHRCPFADPKDWDRAAVTAVFAALFALACAGLQLYAMLHALGLGGVEVFHPWPWWAFHLSCRVCEAGVCLTLSLVVMRPLYCSGELPQPDPGCWPRVFCAGARGRVDVKSPALPNNYQWSLSHQEKLVICDAIARRESECLPLYTLVDNRLSSLDGLDLLYPGGGVPFDADKGGSRKSSFASLHLDSDSTADLRPPSPINLRRSIDEALFGEALFPKSLFGASQLRGSSELSLDAGGGREGRPFGEAERGLYRTSSCVEMETRETRPPPPPPPPEGSSASSRATLEAASGSSAERWRGSSASSSPFGASLDGSSLVLCSSPEGRGGHPSFCSSRITPGHLSQSSLNQVAQLQRRYQALGSASQESLDQPAEQDLAVQAEFISVCRQIDALSVCSDTIDL